MNARKLAWLAVALLLMAVLLLCRQRGHVMEAGKGKPDSQASRAADNRAADQAGVELKQKTHERTAPKNSVEELVERHLRQMTVPNVDFDETSLEEAVDYLRLRVKELEAHDPEPAPTPTLMVEKSGLLDEAQTEPKNMPLIQLHGTNLSAWEILEESARQTGYRIKVQEGTLWFEKVR